ncbi:glycosyltransferase family 4 protein [Streptacidiphilus melanogenes]|uniref:glycosyltransferase family 4 protein n=1 Tax=Streptacidiphilus melanogenes TaxID=411235 RepID=UPI0005A5E1FB|nr:glycosyltransferase family 4 protein [Streptacidiphilus melanogenes]
MSGHLTESSAPLRILQITSTAVGGSWFHDQVRGLARLGNEVCAVLPREGPLADRLRALDGVRVEIIPFGLSRHPRQWPGIIRGQWQLTRFIRQYRPDVVHAHLIIAMLAARAAAACYPRALMVSQVPGLVHLRMTPFRVLDRISLHRDDLLLGSCRAIAARYRAMGARAVEVSYYGCDVHRFDPATPAEPFRTEFDLGGTTPAIGMVAYMYPSRFRDFRAIGVKGHEVFIDAMPLILRRHPQARFFVVGDELVGDGHYRRRLQERAARLGIADRVEFTGLRSDIGSVMAGLDVLVNPSMDESACYTVVEALLMLKGVVASEVGGLPDTVHDGRTGLLVPPADAAALAHAVDKLLTDPDTRRELAAQGRQLALHQFDIERTVGQVNDLYHRMLATPPYRCARLRRSRA